MPRASSFESCLQEFNLHKAFQKDRLVEQSRRPGHVLSQLRMVVVFFNSQQPSGLGFDLGFRSFTCQAGLQEEIRFADVKDPWAAGLVQLLVASTRTHRV